MTTNEPVVRATNAAPRLPERLPLEAVATILIEREAMLAGKSLDEARSEFAWPMLVKLMAAAREGELRLYRNGSSQSAALAELPKDAQTLMNREAYLLDVDAWLDKREPRFAVRFCTDEKGRIETDLCNSAKAVTELNVTADDDKPDVPPPGALAQDVVLWAVNKIWSDPFKLPNPRRGAGAPKAIRQFLKERMPTFEGDVSKALARLKDAGKLGYTEKG